VSRRNFARDELHPRGKSKGKIQKDGTGFKKMMTKRRKQIGVDESSSSSPSSDSSSSSSYQSSLSHTTSSAGRSSLPDAKKQEEELALHEEFQEEPKACFSNGHWYVNGVEMTDEKVAHNVMASVKDGSD
jgi:hypothetical protein